tara:strand:+ start:853 stop:1398 length:546 start_codon:yes stop_codon:yes gene_type:complete
MRHLNFYIIVLCLCLISGLTLFFPVNNSYADRYDEQRRALFNPTGLELPRYASLKSDKVFSRQGPGRRYPIEWVYQQEKLPVKIVQEFDTWRKIEDPDGDSGWVHQSLISGKRTARVNGHTPQLLYVSRQPESKSIARLEPGLIVDLDSCFDGWCKLSVKQYSGWIEKKYLWGLHESERFQ